MKPALALVSMNMTLSSRALASPSSIETCLWVHQHETKYLSERGKIKKNTRQNRVNVKTSWLGRKAMSTSQLEMSTEKDILLGLDNGNSQFNKDIFEYQDIQRGLPKSCLPGSDNFMWGATERTRQFWVVR